MSDTVTVYCRAHHGLVLRLKDRENVVLRGYTDTVDPAGPNQFGTSGCMNSDVWVATNGVPKDFFDTWLDENVQNSLVTDNWISLNPIYVPL
jgi:hypothetical protein